MKNAGDQIIFRAKFIKSFFGKKFGAPPPPPNHFELLRPCSDLLIYTKFKDVTDKCKKLGDDEKTVWSSESVATLLMVNNLIKVLLMPIKFVNLKIFKTIMLCFSN